MVRSAMKWYGWGGELDHFDPQDRPYLWPFAQKHLAISEHQARSPPVSFESITLSCRRENPVFLSCIAEIFPPSRWSIDDFDRLTHSYGKSTRDLWRIRHGRIDFSPDCVVCPQSENEICRLLAAADEHGVIVIPFGGGTNVAGCLEMRRPDSRMVCTVDMRSMNRVLSVDRVSRIARVEAGILGPDLEEALAGHGLMLGHVPDSFPHSTLGGWVASRSAGMFSDGYGNIEDMVVSMRVATPRGFIRTLDVPHASSGPDANWICIGSEGTLGIITEVTVEVREIQRCREFHGYLFPTFDQGIDAIRQCRSSGHAPILSRLNDAKRTQLSAAFRRRGSLVHKHRSPSDEILHRRARLRCGVSQPFDLRIRGGKPRRDHVTATAMRENLAIPRRHKPGPVPGRVVCGRQIRLSLHPRLPHGLRRHLRRQRDGNDVVTAQAPLRRSLRGARWCPAVRGASVLVWLPYQPYLPCRRDALLQLCVPMQVGRSNLRYGGRACTLSRRETRGAGLHFVPRRDAVASSRRRIRASVRSGWILEKALNTPARTVRTRAHKRSSGSRFDARGVESAH
jgi:hypothetical protein